MALQRLSVKPRPKTAFVGAAFPPSLAVGVLPVIFRRKIKFVFFNKTLSRVNPSSKCHYPKTEVRTEYFFLQPRDRSAFIPSLVSFLFPLPAFPIFNASAVQWSN